MECFCYQKLVACLSKSYDGKAFSNRYAIDPVSGNELDLEIELTVKPDEFSDFYNYQKVNYANDKQDIEAPIEYCIKLDRERAFNSAIKDSWTFACERCEIQSGDILSDEQVEEFSRTISEPLRPYIEHRLFGSNFTEKEPQEIEANLSIC